ncbi:MAG: ABC transporter substrate-binding protein [Marivibrio sp.]|uniref:MlaC/ttg2D family ABC transporter substrate-binding protein n=1 Tax=Marivibrio sp. TaxID=2039719 RepID=UPI0032EF27B0
MTFSLMRPRRLAAVALAILTLAAAPAQALDSQQAEQARAVVTQLADDLSTLASRSADLSRAESVEAARDILRDSFDLERIAAATVGASRFEKWTEDQRADYVDAFIRYTLASQTGALTRYEQEKLAIESVQEGPSGLVMVRTTYSGADGASTVDFMLARNAERRFQIVDLVVDGAVSQLQLRRAEFGSVLKSKGYDGLLAILREKTEKLLAKQS